MLMTNVILEWKANFKKFTLFCWFFYIIFDYMVKKWYNKYVAYNFRKSPHFGTEGGENAF